MNRRQLLSECLNNEDFQFNVIDDAVIKIVSRVSGVRYNTLFRIGGVEKFRGAKRLYCDIMINHLKFNQTLIAAKHFRNQDSLILSLLKTVKIKYNEEYHQKRNLCIEIINLYKKHSTINKS